MPLRSGLPASRPRDSGFTFRALIFVAGMLACSGAATDSVAPPDTTPAAIVITPSSPAVILGSQLTLQAQVHDANGQIVTGATVFWSSSDTGVVTVSPTGLITGKTVGTAQVAASSAGHSAIVAVQVVPIPVAAVSVLPAAAALTVGGTVTLQAVTYAGDGTTLTRRRVVWASGAPQVATVDTSGTVTALTAGTATITGTSEGKTAAATITVAVVPVASVTVTPGSAALTVGQSASLAAVATDANGNVLSGRQITWSSSNSAVATVSALGLVNATGGGSSTITASVGGKSGTATIVVQPATPAAVTSVRVSPSTLTLHHNQTATLTAQALDASGNVLTGRTISWTTSDDDMITLTPAGATTLLLAHSHNGTVTITATCSGIDGTASVTITN